MDRPEKRNDMNRYGPDFELIFRILRKYFWKRVISIDKDQRAWILLHEEETDVEVTITSLSRSARPGDTGEKESGSPKPPHELILPFLMCQAK